ncbi:methyltransferase [Nocardia sp. NPDC055053]
MDRAFHPAEQPGSPARSDPAQQIRELVTGYRRAKVTVLAVDLGIADALTDGPLEADELAVRCRTHAPATQRLLEALLEVGLVTRTSAGYALTPAGELLRRDAPGSLARWATTSAGMQYTAWQGSAHAIRTGRPAFDAVFETSFWQHLASHPDAAADFDAAMADSVTESCELVTGDLAVRGATVVADIGGGNGTLAATLLDAHPHLSVLVVDLPGVVERAANALTRFGDRACVEGADFLTGVPAGGDTYVLCRVLSDWDDAQAQVLLANCRTAMNEGGTLLIVGGLRRPGQPAARGLLDLHLLMIIGGRERTEEETADLLASAGFRLDRVEHSPSERTSLIAATAM